VLLGVALVLIGVSAPSDPSEAGTWLTDPSRRAAVALALNLVPFAGIAFLWFIGVIRDRIGQQEDRLFASVFLGSGLLFVGMLSWRPPSRQDCSRIRRSKSGGPRRPRSGGWGEGSPSRC